MVRDLEGDYADKCLIDLMFGLCPLLEVLKGWVDETWAPLGDQVDTIQVFLKGFYIFLFKEKKMCSKF